MNLRTAARSLAVVVAFAAPLAVAPALSEAATVARASAIRIVRTVSDNRSTDVAVRCTGRKCPLRRTSATGPANVLSQAEKRLQTQRKDLTRNWGG
jgi:hypothetical protein